jgi:hypothetical protein
MSVYRAILRSSIEIQSGLGHYRRHAPLKIHRCIRYCIFLYPVPLSPRYHLKRNVQRCPAMCRRWVEARVIRRARLHGLLHSVVAVEDHALRVVFAMRLLVLAFDDGEGLQNVAHVVASDAVEVDIGRVGLA